MNMFVWDSEYFGSYGPGTIVVMAESVSQVREKARNCFDERNKGTSEDTLRDNKRLFENDISQEPFIKDVLFIEGSA
jgi:hypothetical protein